MIPMTSNAAVPTSVPAFIAKLWHMVSDEKCNDLISWSEDETSFIIKDQARFCSQLLPRYYKHNNMASFIRQLNKYGFHKVSTIESSSLRNEKGDFEFAHEFFVKGCVESLEMIKRKMTTTSREVVDIKGDMAPVLQQLLVQVQVLKGNHETFEAKMSTMKRENDALWREHSILRQKYVKQQKMINKLIQFLVTLVQQTRTVNINRNRSVPLILKDLKQSSLMAIEAKKRDTPVICEVDQTEARDEQRTTSSSKANVPKATKYIIRDDPLVSPAPYLINSPIEHTVIEPDCSAMTMNPCSPDDTSTFEMLTCNSYTGVEPSVMWADAPLQSSYPSVGSPLDPTFDLDSPSSSQVMTVNPQDVTPSILTRLVSPQQQNTIPATSATNAGKKDPTPRTRQPPVVVKQEPLDQPSVSPASSEPSTQIDMSDGILSPASEYNSNQKRKNKRKATGSSLVLSENNTRQDIESHLDVVQSDLDSLKDILQGLDTSAIMSLFTEQDPIEFNKLNDSNHRQQLVSFNPGLIDITDMLNDEDPTEPAIPPATPGNSDMNNIDSMLNTPIPTPNFDRLASELNYAFSPKRAKK